MVINTPTHQWLGMPPGMTYGQDDGSRFLSSVRLAYGLDGLGAGDCPSVDPRLFDTDPAMYGQLCSAEVTGGRTSLSQTLQQIIGSTASIFTGTAPNRTPITGATPPTRPGEAWIKGVPNEAVVVGGFALVAMFMMNR